MVIVKGSNLDYLLSLSNIENRRLAFDAVTECIMRYFKDYNDNYLKLYVPVDRESFFKEISKQLPDGYRIKIV